MPTMNLRRAIAFPLLAALLAVGGMACIFGGGGGNEEAVADLTERLETVETQNTKNVVELEVLKADVERVKETNLELTAKVEQLQQDKDAQAAMITGMQGQLAAGAGAGSMAGMAGAGMDYAALDDAAALAKLIDCQVKAANPGAPDAMIAMATGMAQSTFQAQLENNLVSYDDIRGMLPIACAGQ